MNSSNSCKRSRLIDLNIYLSKKKKIKNSKKATLSVFCTLKKSQIFYQMEKLTFLNMLKLNRYSKNISMKIIIKNLNFLA